ncbi:hypothetical protein ACJX0J_036012, partial [Zea mays]
MLLIIISIAILLELDVMIDKSLFYLKILIVQYLLRNLFTATFYLLFLLEIILISLTLILYASGVFIIHILLIEAGGFIILFFVSNYCCLLFGVEICLLNILRLYWDFEKKTSSEFFVGLLCLLTATFHLCLHAPYLYSELIYKKHLNIGLKDKND